MRKFKSTYRWGSQDVMTLGEHMQQMVYRAPDYHAGSVEALEARLSKLTDILSTVMDEVGEKAQTRIAERLGLEDAKD